MTKTKIQKCMDKCLNLITHTVPDKNTYKREKILTLNQLIELENMKLGHKPHHNTLPIKLANNMKTDSKNKTLTKKHRYNTRKKGLYNLAMATNKLYHNSYLFNSIKVFNTLPPKFRNISNCKTFVRYSKSLLFDA